MQEYSCGIPKEAVKEIGTSNKTGTKVTFLPDASIFIETVYIYDILAARLRELAYLNPSIYLSITDKRNKNEDGSYRSNTFYSELGLEEFVLFIDSSREKLIEDVIHISTDKFGTPVKLP